MDFKILKKYLSVGEIALIGQTMLGLKSYIEREVCKVNMVAYFCTDIEIDIDDNNKIVINKEIYENLLKTDLLTALETNIINYNDIDLQYESLVDIKHGVTQLLTTIENKIDTLQPKDWKLDKMGDKIKELLINTAKQV